MNLLDRPLDVLRIDVASVNDDQILQPTGDEEVTVDEASQITGAEKGTLAGVGKVRLKCRSRFVGSLPVPFCNVWPRDPHLADLVWPASCQRFRVGDLKTLPLQLRSRMRSAAD